MKKRATQLDFDGALLAPEAKRASAARAGRRPPARKTPADYRAEILKHIAAADLEKKLYDDEVRANIRRAIAPRHPTGTGNPSAEPAILVREGYVHGMGDWRQYFVVTDDRVAVVHMEPSLAGGWNIDRVDVQGHDAWAGMTRDKIVAWKLHHDDGLTRVAQGLGDFRTRLLEVARSGRLTR